MAFTQILLALLNILIDNHCTNTYNAVKIEYQTQNKTKVASYKTDIYFDTARISTDLYTSFVYWELKTQQISELMSHKSGQGLAAGGKVG